ncbi:MAG: PilN domain-containing protein [Acidimicrobiia bacterium]
MRPINLLPPELGARKLRRRRLAMLAGVGAAYVVLLGVLVLFWNGRVDDAKRDVEDQISINQTLEREVIALADAGDLAVRYQDKADLVRTALSTDVDWGIILNDLARLLPPRVWVETFSGSVVAETVPGVVGQVGFSGVGFDFPDVSAWLRALDSEQFAGITGTWVSTVSQGVAGNEPVVNFTSTAVLTIAAVTNRADELIPEVP